MFFATKHDSAVAGSWFSYFLNYPLSYIANRLAPTLTVETLDVEKLEEKVLAIPKNRVFFTVLTAIPV